MDVPKKVAYRIAALDHYKTHRCVYCGFGIAAVLEVAHLDCDPGNCEVDNLALLCPTCHRMHDLDLIPTDVIRQMRDVPREVRWAKLAKDAPKKAGLTRRRQTAARKAAATRKRRLSEEV